LFGVGRDHGMLWHFHRVRGSARTKGGDRLC
jgi:hypothetical protein